MMNDIEIWLDRLASLYKSQLRQAASSVGMPLVHVEILQYLAMANQYSNTAQSVSEYLGQTKGSISQSLKVLEKDGYIQRQACSKDKRVTKLFLTVKGEQNVQKVTTVAMPNLPENEAQVAVIQSLLQSWQSNNNLKGFGQCRSCKFNIEQQDGQFKCGLTQANLTLEDIKKICREHEFGDKKA